MKKFPLVIDARVRYVFLACAIVLLVAELMNAAFRFAGIFCSVFIILYSVTTPRPTPGANRR